MRTSFKLDTFVNAVALYKGSEWTVSQCGSSHVLCIEDSLYVTDIHCIYEEDTMARETVFFDKEKQTISFKYGDYDGCVHDITVPCSDTTINMLNQMVVKFTE